MDLKKFAVSGVIILAIVVAVCIFFSGTLRSITTPKVKIALAHEGKLSQTVELTGTVEFLDSEKIYVASGEMLNIKSVKVQSGDKVEEGDVIFTAEIDSFEEERKSCLESYTEAQEQLDELENRNVRLKRSDEAWEAAYKNYSDMRDEYIACQIDFKAYLRNHSIELIDGELPEGADDEAKEMFKKMTEVSENYEKAKEEYSKANRYAVSEDVKTYITDKIKYTKQLEDAEKKLLDISEVNSMVAEVTAPEDGYIAEIFVNEGESFDSDGCAYRLCGKDGTVVARLDITECELTITKGSDAVIIGSDDEIEAEVKKIGIDAEGGKYADVELSSKQIKKLGGLEGMMNGVTAKITYKAKESTTLIPTAALRGSGDERYIYLLRTSESGFGTQNLVTVKQDVTVLAISDGTASIEEHLYDAQIAYMEDREIAEDTAVMKFEE